MGGNRRQTVRPKIEHFFQFYNGEATATEVARRLGLPVASVASCLRRMVDEGELKRVPGTGPRGGYGYARKLLFDSLWERAMEQMQREMDRQMLEMYGETMKKMRVI